MLQFMAVFKDSYVLMKAMPVMIVKIKVYREGNDCAFAE